MLSSEDPAEATVSRSRVNNPSLKEGGSPKGRPPPNERRASREESRIFREVSMLIEVRRLSISDSVKRMIISGYWDYSPGR